MDQDELFRTATRNVSAQPSIDGWKTNDLLALTGAEGGTTLLAGVPISAFGLKLVAATLIATLVMRLFGDTAGEEICKWWGEHLEDVPKQDPSA